MLRKIIGLTACCLLVTCVVVAAPRKDDPASGYYLPSKVGDKFVIESDDGDERWENANEVTQARQKGAAVVVTVRDPSAGEGEPCQFEVSDRGLYKLGDGVAFEPRHCQLKLPFKKGETWDVIAKTEFGDTVTCRYTSADEEEIEVPAGKFRCLRVESECVVRKVTWKITSWTAPRVGTVKVVHVGKDGDRPDYVLTSVLKSFTPGGK